MFRLLVLCALVGILFAAFCYGMAIPGFLKRNRQDMSAGVSWWRRVAGRFVLPMSCLSLIGLLLPAAFKSVHEISHLGPSTLLGLIWLTMLLGSICDRVFPDKKPT